MMHCWIFLKLINTNQPNFKFAKIRSHFLVKIYLLINKSQQSQEWKSAGRFAQQFNPNCYFSMQFLTYCYDTGMKRELVDCNGKNRRLVSGSTNGAHHSQDTGNDDEGSLIFELITKSERKSWYETFTRNSTEDMVRLMVSSNDTDSNIFSSTSSTLGMVI